MRTPLFAIAALPALLLVADEPLPREYQDTKTQSPLQDDLERPPVTDADPSAKDIAAVVKLHHDNEMEINLGKLAKQNSESKQVKRYGEVLVRDHTLADRQVRSFAKRNGIELTAVLPEDTEALAAHQAKMNTMKRLETLKGEDFDREFIPMMIDDHEKAVDLVETTQRQTQSSKVHRLLTRVLPVLKEHLKLAERINQTLQNV